MYTESLQDFHLAGRGREGVWAAWAVVLSVSEKECPTSRLGFAKLLTDTPRTVVVWCLGQPELESHHVLPHPALSPTVGFQLPPRLAPCLHWFSALPYGSYLEGRSQPKASPWACCGAAGSPTRGCCWSERLRGEGAGAGSGEGGWKVKS